MAAGNNSQVKAIFNRCLLNCPNVPLWTYYLSFIKKVALSLCCIAPLFLLSSVVRQGTGQHGSWW